VRPQQQFHGLFQRDEQHRAPPTLRDARRDPRHGRRRREAPFRDVSLRRRAERHREKRGRPSPLSRLARIMHALSAPTGVFSPKMGRRRGTWLFGAALFVGAASAWADAPGDGVDLIERGRQLFEDQRYEESILTLTAALLRPKGTEAE